MDATPPSAPLPICSALSNDVGEVLPGTAPQAGVFVLLEYNGAWGEKAFEESDIPAEVKSWLNAQVKAIPKAKLLLIKSRGGWQEPAIRLFVAEARPERPALHSASLKRYEDALGLDLARVLAGAGAGKETQSPRSLFLVCTNGQRDACCARYGPQVFQELQKAMHPDLGEQVWQTTHVGGHRFAANLLCLPSGLLYGRMRPPDVAPLLQAHRQDAVDARHYRGRSAYPEPAQAAEGWLLERAGPGAGRPDHRLEEVQEAGPDRWRVRFANAEGALKDLQVVRETTGIETYESCPKGNPPQVGKTSFLMQYRVSAWPG